MCATGRPATPGNLPETLNDVSYCQCLKDWIASRATYILANHADRQYCDAYKNWLAPAELAIIDLSAAEAEAAGAVVEANAVGNKHASMLIRLHVVQFA